MSELGGGEALKGISQSWNQQSGDRRSMRKEEMAVGDLHCFMASDGLVCGKWSQSGSLAQISGELGLSIVSITVLNGPQAQNRGLLYNQ